MPDLNTIGGFLATLFAGAVTILGGLATWKKAKAESVSTGAKDIEDRFTRQEERIARLEARNDALEARERLLMEYIYALQYHINTGQPPPPPLWPVALLPFSPGGGKA